MLPLVLYVWAFRYPLLNLDDAALWHLTWARLTPLDLASCKEPIVWTPSTGISEL